jgi:hypothetical protein
MTQTLRRELRNKFRPILEPNFIFTNANRELVNAELDKFAERLADAALEVSGIQKRAETQEVIQQADRKVDAILDGMKQSENHWLGREKMPEPIRDLLDVFVECSGVKPTRGLVNDWFATGSDWLEIGATGSDVRDAYEKSKPNADLRRTGFTVGRPGSLTTTLQAVVGERRKSDKPKSNKEFMDKYL